MINDCIIKASIQVTTVMERELLPMTVQVELSLIFGNTDPYHQAVGLERVRFFLNHILDKSVICSRENPILSDLKAASDTRIVECWDDPWDQFIALMVYYKVNSILEGAGTIDYIKVSGDSLAPDIEYKYYTDSFTGEMIESDAEFAKNNKLSSLWYHRPDTTINEDTDLEMTWKMLGLDWAKEDNEPGKVKKFTPRIIK